MGIEDRDYYRSGGASGGGYLTTCPQCGRSLASTLWRMHAHNPQQAHCVEAGCRERAVGYCAEAPFAGGLGPLCGEHLMRHRRQRHDVRFVDGGVCSECDGQGHASSQGVGQGAGDGWLRCLQCSGLGYESEDVRERRRERARQEEKESRRREENRRAAEEARRRSEESRRAAEERGRRQEAEGAWRGRTGYEGSAQCAACGGAGRVPTKYHQALDVPLGASSEEITRAFRGRRWSITPTGTRRRTRRGGCRRSPRRAPCSSDRRAYARERHARFARGGERSAHGSRRAVKSRAGERGASRRAAAGRAPPRIPAQANSQARAGEEEGRAAKGDGSGCSPRSPSASARSSISAKSRRLRPPPDPRPPRRPGRRSPFGRLARPRRPGLLPRPRPPSPQRGRPIPLGRPPRPGRRPQRRRPALLGRPPRLGRRRPTRAAPPPPRPTRPPLAQRRRPRQGRQRLRAPRRRRATSKPSRRGRGLASST